MKENPIITRGFRPVISGLEKLYSQDLTEDSSVRSVSSIFSEYYTLLKVQAQRSDRPELASLYLLSSVCNPKIFPGKSEYDKDDLPFTSPGTNPNHPLYELAQYTQSLAWGAAYLRGVENWTPQGVDPNVRMAVVEWHMSKEAGFFGDEIARVPIIIYPDSNDYRVVGRVVEAFREFETKIALRVRYGQDRKRPEVIAGEYSPLVWPLAAPGGRLNSPVVGALLGRNDLDQSQTEFFDITLSAGSMIRKWQGGSVTPVFKMWQPDGNVWSAWSFKNTLYKIGQVSFENVLRSLKNVSTEVHLPLQILAAHAETVVAGMKRGMDERVKRQEALDSDAARREAGAWEHFNLE